MVLYPIAQVICFVPATINRFYNIITKEDLYALTVIQSIVDYCMGFIITLIFIFSPAIKYSLLARICRKKRVVDSTVWSEDFQGRLSDISYSY
jgi:hypothetical protein